LRSLSGVKRTCRFALHMSVFDPKRTSWIRFEDVAGLLNALLQQHVADYCTTRSRAGASIDTINAELQNTIMPRMSRWHREQLARAAVFFDDDPRAPSHAVNWSKWVRYRAALMASLLATLARAAMRLSQPNKQKYTCFCSRWRR